MNIVATKQTVIVVHWEGKWRSFPHDASLGHLKGLPWKPGPEEGENTNLADAIRVEPEMPKVNMAAPEAYEVHSKHRKQVYMLRSDVEELGYRPRCPARKATKKGQRKPGEHKQSRTKDC